MCLLDATDIARSHVYDGGNLVVFLVAEDMAHVVELIAMSKGTKAVKLLLLFGLVGVDVVDFELYCPRHDVLEMLAHS